MEPRIVIIGGVAGGMSAATRARRMNEQASITVLEKTGHISFANCGLPYFIGGQIKDERSLFLTTPDLVSKRYRIDARVHHEVTVIDRAAHRVEGINHETGESFTLLYDKLILAPGASPIIPQMPGIDAENVFVLRNVEDAERLDEFLAASGAKRAVVVGAGFIGLEMVEALHSRGLRVTVVEKAPHSLPPLDDEMSGWVEQELDRHGVALRLGQGLSALTVTGARVSAIQTESGESIETDLVVLAMGVRPLTKLAQTAGLVVGASGGIAVDEALRTSDPDVYAVGDATEVTQGVADFVTRIPLAGAANRHGRLAGEHAATGRSRSAAKVFGTAVVRIFELDVAMTGLSYASAKKLGYDAERVIIHPNDHAGYYPGARRMHLQLVYDRAGGRVLGAQAIGGAGVDKRIDVIATLLHFHGTTDDLAELDLCYAPQFSGAKDPVHYAAFVAQNQQHDVSPGVERSQAGVQLVDVRSAKEFARGSLEGAVNIPIDDLRDNWRTLDPEKPTVVFCHVGIRAHLATRILKQVGFKDVRNLKGGYEQARERTRMLPT
jgi:NADPH-dependent 2,4-dienoyl-CoA reductase/sulfur reductase-like enzyme/rhodanese-related sulfurtransferase